MFQINILDDLLLFRFKCFDNHLQTENRTFGIFRFKPLEKFGDYCVLWSVQALHHLQDNFESDFAECWLSCVDLLKQIVVARESYMFDVLSELDKRVQAVQSL